jgi:Fe-S cluster biogenesis protein NfuA
MNNTIKEALKIKVELALDSIRPHLIVDGGDIEVIDISDDYELKLKWVGNCESCNMSAMTMKAGVEQTIRQHVPEIKAVSAVNGIPTI